MVTVKTHAIRTRPDTKEKYEKYATGRRLTMVEVADMAIDALNLLPREQQEALRERRPVRPRRTSDVREAQE